MSVLKNSFSLMRSTLGVLTGRTSIQLKQNNLNLAAPILSANVVDFQKRYMHVHKLSHNINYYTNHPGLNPRVNQDTMKLKSPITRPLIMMMCWLNSSPKNVRKYAEIYLEQGYDIITIHIPIFECFFPESGTMQAIKKYLLFLEANECYETVFMKSFSIGCFMWAEMMLMIKAERERFQPAIDRFRVQIWDSMVDGTVFQGGVAKGIFPNNPIMRNLTYYYIGFHMKAFHDISSKYYMRASLNLHDNICTAPKLLLFSKTDIVGTEKVNRHLMDSWVKTGHDITYKCWDESPHVQHYPWHPIEYLTEIKNFLTKHDLLLDKEAMDRRIEIMQYKQQFMKPKYA